MSRPGGWSRSETALAWVAPDGVRVLFTGDALNGQCTPEQPNPYYLRRSPGLYVGVRYQYLQRVAAPAGLRTGLQRLLAEEVDLVCGAHGVPYRTARGAGLADLLALDWSAILAAGHLPAVYN